MTAYSHTPAGKKEYNKNYYQRRKANKGEVLKPTRKVIPKVKCECGLTVNENLMWKHTKGKVHLAAMYRKTFGKRKIPKYVRIALHG